MALYALDELTTGMILGKDIKDNAGRTLLKAGSPLLDKHLKILKTWGINHVDIESNELQVDLEDIINKHPEFEKEALTEGSKLFSHTDNTHKFFTTLIPLWKKRYIRNLASKL